MKLQPKRLASKVEEPFSEDLLARRDFSDKFTKLVSSVEDHGVICLDAPWGEGKSTFISLWRQALSKNKIHIITYEAFENDWHDDVLVSFLEEISIQLRQEFPNEERMTLAVDAFVDKAISVGRILLRSALHIGARVLTGMGADQLGVGDLKQDAGQITGEVVDKVVARDLTEYRSRKNTLESFQKTLQEVAQLVRERQNFPLVIVIDELDRTRPKHALKLLELVKHLFDVQNVVFVLVTNLDQMRKVVQSEMGTEVDATIYLQKFIGLSITLPQKRIADAESDYYKYFRSLILHHSLKIDPDLQNVGSEIIAHFRLSLREMEKIALNFAVFQQTSAFGGSFLVVVLLLLIVRTTKPELFSRIQNGQVKYRELTEALNLQVMYGSSKYSGYGEYLERTLKFHFLTEDELNKDEKKTEIEEMGRGLGFATRKSLVPRYCRDISLPS